MGFLQPLALLGLAAVAVPPLLHLLARRMPPVVVFPALRYLKATEREHSRRLKLRNLLLMLLRMAVIGLIVLAASRPVADVGAGGLHPPTAVAVIVDNSLSSGAVVSGRTVLDRLRDRANQLFADLAVGDELWIVTADGQPRRMGRTDAAALLDTLTPMPVRLDLANAARQAATVVEQSSLLAQEVLVLSDLQATAFSTGDHITTRSLWLGSENVPPNRGIDSAFAEPVLWSPGGTVVVGVSGVQGNAAAVQLNVGDLVLTRAVATAGARVALDGSLPDYGWYQGILALDPDELRADDEWWLALRSVRPAGVRFEAGAGDFVRDAVDVLRSGGRVVNGSAVTLADELGPQVTVLFPPTDPARVGAINRALLAQGLSIGFGPIESGEWLIEGSFEAITGTAVRRRHRVTGDGQPLATIGGVPWLVREGNVIIVGSRMDETWTTLPLTAGFLPFLDFMINRVAAAESWIERVHPGDLAVLPPATASVATSRGQFTVAADRQFRAPLENGVFFLLDAAGDTIGALEVNHDSREGELAPAEADLVRATVGDDARVLDGAAFVREAFGSARRAELSGILLLAAIIAALVELALATAGSRTQSD